MFKTPDLLVYTVICIVEQLSHFQWSTAAGKIMWLQELDCVIQNDNFEVTPFL